MKKEILRRRDTIARMQARLATEMPDSADLCTCGHRGQAHVFCCDSDTMNVGSTCRGVDDLKGPGDPRNYGCGCRGFKLRARAEGGVQ